MSKAAMGAVVQYCGHDGTFIADIFEIDGVNVVRTSFSVTLDKLERPAVNATHLLKDYPRAGFWRPDLGVFVVPGNQVTELKTKTKVKVS